MSRYAASIRRLEMMAVFEARGPAASLSAALAAAAVPAPTQANRFEALAGGARVMRIGPRRAIVTGPAAREPELERALGAAFDGEGPAAIANLSDLFVAFEIAGPGAIDVLKQGTALDLRPGNCPLGFASGTDLWGVGVILLREDTDRFEILVDRALAGYLDGWFAAASGIAQGPRPGTMRSPPASYRPS
jgi:heterotetrameric sarcosine oxidase gamma subunit